MGRQTPTVDSRRKEALCGQGARRAEEAQLSRLPWILGTALAALVALGAALRLRAGGQSRMQVLAREYLVEQLAAQGIAKRVPTRYVAEIARRYADLVEPRPLTRLAAVSDLMRHLDAVVLFLAAWVQDGREFPRSIGELPLPGAQPDVLQRDVLDADVPDAEESEQAEQAENLTR